MGVRWVLVGAGGGRVEIALCAMVVEGSAGRYGEIGRLDISTATTTTAGPTERTGMPTFQRTTVVDAPLDEVWAFHSTIDGLRALTPSWSGLVIESVVGPDGTRGPESLTVGTGIEMQVSPLGILPGPGFTSEITRRERDDGEAVFRDTMVGGPFETWEHTHRFLAVGERTVVEDRLEFALPSSVALFTPFVHVGLAGLFAYRHRRTRSLLGGSGE